ncbi:MAG TPA: hypothetical protein VNO30_23060 [Kofleriaceae bacterium]|nr:hypothetical protein [Kofleriaceae bacterium]
MVCVVRSGGQALALAATVACASCTPAHAPPIRSAGKVMALGGVAGIVGSAFATNVTDSAHEMMIGFEVISAVGILSYAYAELAWPRVRYIEETLEHKHTRWAKILTERAAGAAREGRCARVRRLEVRVHQYDRVTHDLVFMKDPEILRCLGVRALPGGAPAAPDLGTPPAPDLGAPPAPDLGAPPAQIPPRPPDPTLPDGSSSPPSELSPAPHDDR